MAMKTMPRGDAEPAHADHPAAGLAGHLRRVELVAQLRRDGAIELVHSVARDTDCGGPHDPFAGRELERRPRRLLSLLAVAARWFPKTSFAALNASSP